MSANSLFAAGVLLVIFVGGFAAHVWLGGMDEAGRWDVPEDALDFLNLAYKSTFGAFSTIVAQMAHRSMRHAPPT